jgi:hypothetical protein
MTYSGIMSPTAAQPRPRSNPQDGTTGGAGEPRHATFVIGGLIALVLVAAAAFYLVGRFASRMAGFDWELASIFGTAVGTVLLALATGLLALLTRSEVIASRQELVLSRTALQGSTRPILVDAPLDVFTVERESRGGFRRVGEPTSRDLIDLAEIHVSAWHSDGPREPEGYAEITVPLHNVGAGLALIRDASLRGFDPGWEIRPSSAVDGHTIGLKGGD